MRLLRGVVIAILLTSAAAPAEAGKRPPLVVAVDKGDAKSLAKLLKKAKAKDLDAFDDKRGSPTAGMRAIEVAAKKGDAAAVHALLAAGATATAKALEYAADRGQLAIVQELVEKKAPRADLALSAAAKAGHADIVRLLLPAAKTADPYFNLDQVLEFAVYFPAAPSAKVVDLLVQAGAKTHIQWGPGKQTVLHLAVAKGANDVVDVLLAAGAPVDADDGDGVTPLLVAIRAARFDLARKLLGGGADPRKTTNRSDTAFSLLMQSDPAATDPLFDTLLDRVPVDFTGKDGVTALMIAAGNGNKPWVRRLVAGNASFTSRDPNGRMPIDYALACSINSGYWAPPTITACHGEVARIVSLGAGGQVDRFKRTPLMRAIMSGDGELVRLMLSGWRGEFDPDQWGNTAIHYAARFGTAVTVQLLLGTKAAASHEAELVNEPNQRGETPLAIARAAGRTDVEKALIAAGAK